jgi:hypothetical protein
MIDLGDITDNLRIRVKARQRLLGYAGLPGDRHHDAASLLARLLGYADYNQLIKNQTDQDTATMLKLIGEHGYSIYRILLARG